MRWLGLAIVTLMLSAAMGSALRPKPGLPSTQDLDVIRIEPLVFLETKGSGQQFQYQAYQAIVSGDPDVLESDMLNFGRRLFVDRLRPLADSDHKSRVWITFYLDRGREGENRDTEPRDGEPKVVDVKIVDDRIVEAKDADPVKTFRMVFLRDGRGWRQMALNGSSTRM